MSVRAKLGYLRIAPRKVRLVVDLIRGKDVIDAQRQLEILPRMSSQPVLKLLRSAIANAVTSHKSSESNLYVSTVFVNEGMTIKRFRPRAFGRAAPIRRRTCSVVIELDERVPTKKEAVKTDKKVDEKPKTKKIGTKTTKTAEKKVAKAKKETKKTPAKKATTKTPSKKKVTKD